MDYKQLLNFLAVCNEKNFTRASSQRFISQQGLSISIKALEDELEVPLFYRNPKGIELTEFGAILEAAAKSYINQHEHIIETIRQHKEKTKPHISIGMANGLDQLLPPNFLSTFIVEHPDISLNIMNFIEDACQQSMLENKLQS
jgi:DNA-binding transcriptional LysR family regulator